MNYLAYILISSVIVISVILFTDNKYSVYINERHEKSRENRDKRIEEFCAAREGFNYLTYSHTTSIYYCVNGEHTHDG